MQKSLNEYTTNMLRLCTIFLTIAIAVTSGILVAHSKNKSYIQNLLNSDSVTDQLTGLRSLNSESLLECYSMLSNVLERQTEASVAAERLLVKKAFQEDNVEFLQTTSLDPELVANAFWWNEFQETQPTTKPSLVDITSTSPWITKLHTILQPSEANIDFDAMRDLPVCDRDGSVLLTVIAMAGSEDTKQIISEFSTSLDTDKQKVALLLSALIGKPLPDVDTANSELRSLHAILESADVHSAWRSMHRENGAINPDVALAGMIADMEVFMPLLLDSVEQQKWEIPEHPVLIVRHFAPEVANRVPHDLLSNTESRQKWWGLFSCGLLKEWR